MYGSSSSSDVTLIDGTSRKEFVGHTCMVELRADALYELISTTETSSETNSSEDIVLPDIDGIAVEALLLFIYKNTLSTITAAAISAISVRYAIPPRRRPVEPENPSAITPLSLAPYRPRKSPCQSQCIDANRATDGVSSFKYEEWPWKYKDTIYDRTICRP